MLVDNSTGCVRAIALRKMCLNSHFVFSEQIDRKNVSWIDGCFLGELQDYSSVFSRKYLIEIENKEKILFSVSILTSKTHSDDFVSNMEAGGQRETSRRKTHKPATTIRLMRKSEYYLHIVMCVDASSPRKSLTPCSLIPNWEWVIPVGVRWVQR